MIVQISLKSEHRRFAHSWYCYQVIDVLSKARCSGFPECMFHEHGTFYLVSSTQLHDENVDIEDVEDENRRAKKAIAAFRENASKELANYREHLNNLKANGLSDADAIVLWDKACERWRLKELLEPVDRPLSLTDIRDKAIQLNAAASDGLITSEQVNELLADLRRKALAILEA